MKKLLATLAALAGAFGFYSLGATATVLLLSYAPIAASWINISPNGVVVYTAPENEHIHSITGRVSSPAGGAAQVVVYKTKNLASCTSGTLLLAVGTAFDANGTKDAVQNLKLGADTSLATGDSVCLSATGSFTQSIANITISIGS